MDGRPFNYLEHAARERQRTLIAEAQRLAMARLAAGDARSGWRSAVAAFGRALARVGRRLEALEDVRGAGPASAPRRWGRPPAEDSLALSGTATRFEITMRRETMLAPILLIAAWR